MTDKEIKKLNKQINEQKHEINRLITICNKYKQENQLLKGRIETYHKGCKEIYKENKTIKNLIKEAYQTERTQLGRSVLKQLLEAIQ